MTITNLEHNFTKLVKPKIAIFSDLHLGKHNNSAEWHKIAETWCDWFIEDLKARKIKDVVFMGDWHDNRSDISVHTLHTSAKLIDKFEEFNLHMIVGNHDIPYKKHTDVSSISIYANRPNVNVYDRLYTIESFDRRITFAPWEADLTQLDKKSDVILGHLEIQSFKMNAMKTCEHGWKITDLLAKANLIFSGHFHIKSKKIYKEGEIIYTGNPFQMDFGDAGDQKGYYILDLDTMKYEFIENNISPIHVKVKLSDINANGLKRYELDIIGNIVRLNVDVDFDSKEIIKLFQKITALRPLSFNPDYTYIAQQVGGTVNVEDQISAIDIRRSITDYVDAIDIYGKDKVIAYLLEAYDKSR